MKDLDEAIQHCEEVAEEQEENVRKGRLQEQDKYADDCERCVKEHRQLAEWLKGYKRLLEEKHKDKWTRLAVEKPKFGEDVLILIKHSDGTYQQAFSALYDYTYWANFGRDINVTHWRPRLELPEEVEE